MVVVSLVSKQEVGLEIVELEVKSLLEIVWLSGLVMTELKTGALISLAESVSKESEDNQEPSLDR